jgi:hypothetical protein
MRRRLEVQHRAGPVPLPLEPRQEQQEHSLEDVRGLGSDVIAAGESFGPGEPTDQERSLDATAQDAAVALDQQPDRRAIVALESLD